MKCVLVKGGMLYSGKHSKQGVTSWVYFVYLPIYLFLNILFLSVCLTQIDHRYGNSKDKLDVFLCFRS